MVYDNHTQRQNKFLYLLLYFKLSMAISWCIYLLYIDHPIVALIQTSISLALSSGIYNIIQDNKRYLNKWGSTLKPHIYDKSPLSD